MAELKWHGSKVSAQIQAASYENLVMAAFTLLRHMRKLLSVSAGGRSQRAQKIREEISAGRIVAPDERVEKYRHSDPGEPPRKITGFLQRNVTLREQPSQKAVQVGLFKNAIYGYYLERGVKNEDRGGWKIAPRPWMVRSLVENMAELARIAATGKRSSGGANDG